MIGNPTIGRAGATGTPPATAAPAAGVPTIQRVEQPLIQPGEQAPKPRVRPNEAASRAAPGSIRRKGGPRTAELASEFRGHSLYRTWESLVHAGPALSAEKRLELLKTTTSLIGSARSTETAFKLAEALREAGVEPTVQVHGALMSRASKAGRDSDIAIRQLKRLEGQGIAPNKFIATAAITAYGKLDQLDEARAMLESLDSRDADVKAYGSLASVFAKKGDVAAVEELIRKWEGLGREPDDRMLGSRALAYGKAGRLEEAMRCFDGMRGEGRKPHLSVCNTLMSACVKDGNTQAALHLARCMERDGTRPNSVTLAALVQTCVNAGDAHAAVEAVALCRHLDVLRKAAGYDRALDHLSLAPRDLLSDSTDLWRTDHALAALGVALAQFHLAQGNLKATTRIDGPGRAREAAIAVQRSALRPRARL